MGDTPQVHVPRFTITLAGRDAMTVVVPNGVQVRWELERQKKQWPSIEEAPTLWSSWVTWASAVRDGQVESSMPYEAWTDQLQLIEFLDPVAADPTNPAPEAA